MNMTTLQSPEERYKVSSFESVILDREGVGEQSQLWRPTVVIVCLVCGLCAGGGSVISD